MRAIRRTSQFKKDVKRMKKRGEDLSRFRCRSIRVILCAKQQSPPRVFRPSVPAEVKKAGRFALSGSTERSSEPTPRADPGVAARPTEGRPPPAAHPHLRWGRTFWGAAHLAAN